MIVSTLPNLYTTEFTTVLQEGEAIVQLLVIRAHNIIHCIIWIVQRMNYGYLGEFGNSVERIHLQLYIWNFKCSIFLLIVSNSN